VHHGPDAASRVGICFHGPAQLRPNLILDVTTRRAFSAPALTVAPLSTAALKVARSQMATAAAKGLDMALSEA
jgi:hypothetical protein